ncbi:aldehyde dehydrogenase family protein [Candidatus Parcubacteria bacterium]|nr:aldehyde dehydrogenase family protein [Candidatus Parcubacteria bacterium]MCG2694417.1 aldehyde dehydrogenase family protein [Candidatus Parcubacteria bacterium]
MEYPNKILHWIGDNEVASLSGEYFVKDNPINGELLAEVTKGNKEDVEKAINVAELAYFDWSNTPVIERARIIRRASFIIEERKNEIAKIVSKECGKSEKNALGEIIGASECGFFFAGEGQRFNGSTLTSSVKNRKVYMTRESTGVGALFVPFNNPIASIAWKTFPALLCGNTVVLKSHEFTPYIAILFAHILQEAGLPKGVFNVIQGFGVDVGIPLIKDKRVSFVSFTGSYKTARSIIKDSADNLTKVSVESGGKNPMVICDDADLERAVEYAVLSAFVDAGQRCAASSRIIVMEPVYEKFKELFLNKIKDLKIGVEDDCAFGAIINKNRMLEILSDIKTAEDSGAKIIFGGKQIREKGYFIEPTVIEGLSPEHEISQKEIFGPVVALYRAKDFDEAMNIANNSQYNLSSSLHTKSIHRANQFIDKIKAGVARVNGPTYGSEPHMPFGGMGLSGNGWREPGEKALDFYSEWKQVSIDY